METIKFTNAKGEIETVEINSKRYYEIFKDDYLKGMLYFEHWKKVFERAFDMAVEMLNKHIRKENRESTRQFLLDEAEREIWEEQA